jgi:hypothetical protein
MYIHTNKSSRAETENFLKRDNSVKNHRNATKLKLYLCNSKMYPYIKFELNVCDPYRDNEWKQKISIFSKFKRDNSVKNQQTKIKFELDLCIPMTNLHMQFQSSTCIKTKVRERKLKISIFFKVQEG